MIVAEQLAPVVGVVPTCQALGISRASFYRRRRLRHTVKSSRPKPKRSLSPTERQTVLEVLNSKRFSDKAPAEVYITLLNEGTYLCSTRTMYRLLAQDSEAREQRNSVRCPKYQRPQRLAAQPNQLWSWDIIKLPGPNQWTNFYLYVILDHFSHYVVGWRVFHRESGSLIGQLIQETCRKQKVTRNQLTLRSDRSSLVTAKPVTSLLSDLGIPQTRNQLLTFNNQNSEAQLKTLKNQPRFPIHFSRLENAQSFCQKFLAWYNKEYHHGENSLLTPEIVHYRLDQQITEQRQWLTLLSAYMDYPERFVRHPPQPPGLCYQSWLRH